MTIEIITMWYNEEFLAPFFLKHYSWVDQINILLDSATTDFTQKIADTYKNVKIIPFNFTEKYDDQERIEIQNSFYKKLSSDYVIIVDADEFIFYKENDNFIYNLKSWLKARNEYDIYKSHIYQVYKHNTETDLDPKKEAIPQRRHGDPNIDTGINKLYKKPCIAKGKLPIEWTLGNHNIKNLKNLPMRECEDNLIGAHWANADLKYSLERRLSRKKRFSKRNYEKGWGIQNITATEESIIVEHEMHKNDPQLF